MNIISLGFLAFVLLTAAVYYLLPLKLRPFWLLAASLFFYIYADIRYLLFLLASILSCYAGARAIQGRTGRKKFVLLLVLLFNLGLLACVKFLPYSLNLLGLVLGRELPQPRLLVPLGISFYTLQALSYLIDVYRGEIRCERRLWSFALYMSFFPIIMQGPICRYSQLSPQLSSPHRLDYRQLKFGAQLMLWGFFKKLVIADRAGLLVNQVFDNYEAYAGLSVFLAMCLYTFQLYADFSGCVDISRGVSGMLGISLPDNFRRPLFSQSIQEFWRRWHISLSSWFRDYVYIPLGGSRCSKAKLARNLMIVWMLTGIWHGAGWTFLLWGLYYGLLLLLEKLLLRPVLQKLPAPIQWLYTMVLVLIGWVFFASADFAAAWAYLTVLFTPVAGTAHIWLPGWLPLGLIGAVAATPLGAKLWGRWKSANAPEAAAAVLCTLALVLSTASLVSGSYNPFIYFNF